MRAIETARLALETAGIGALPTERDPALNERMYGDLQGLNKAEAAQRFGAEQVHLWRRSYDVRPPGGESWEVFWDRVAIAWQRIVDASRATNGRDLVLVTHGLVCHAILDRHVHYTDLAPERWHNTSVTELDHAPPWTPRVVNCVAHLDAMDGDVGIMQSDDFSGPV